MRTKIVIFPFASESADTQEVQAFLSALLVLLLKINNNEVKTFAADFRAWVDRSQAIASKLKVKRVFNKICNSFMVTGNVTEDDIVELGAQLKTARPILERDTTLTFEQYNMFKDIQMSLHKDSLPAWKRIEKNIAILKNNKLSQAFTPEDEPVDAEDDDSVIPVATAARKLKALATKLTGNAANPFLTVQEMQELRASHPDELKEYAAYARVLSTALKKEVLKFVRASGKDLVSIDVLKDHMTKRGILNNLPTGFTGGQMDEKCNGYTKEGRKLDRIPMGTVVMNPKYDPEKDNTYVMTSVGLPRVRYRTVTFLADNKQHRHSLIKEFLETEDASRQKWVADLVKIGTKDQIFAAITEIMYQTSCRIGGRENKTNGETTYGLTTLEVRHLTFAPTHVQFNYSGKKAADQEHVLNTTSPDGKKVRAVLTALVKNKKPGDLVFTYKNKPVLDTAVRVYLKSIGIQISPHKFRHIAGTKAAMKILATSPFKKSTNPQQKKVEAWVKEAMKKVGEILHHRSGTQVTGMTALKSYIDPEVVGAFFDNLGLRRPTFIPS